MRFSFIPTDTHEVDFHAQQHHSLSGGATSFLMGKKVLYDPEGEEAYSWRLWPSQAKLEKAVEKVNTALEKELQDDPMDDAKYKKLTDNDNKKLGHKHLMKTEVKDDLIKLGKWMKAYHICHVNSGMLWDLSKKKQWAGPLVGQITPICRAADNFVDKDANLFKDLLMRLTHAVSNVDDEAFFDCGQPGACVFDDGVAPFMESVGCIALRSWCPNKDSPLCQCAAPPAALAALGPPTPERQRTRARRRSDSGRGASAAFLPAVSSPLLPAAARPAPPLSPEA